MISAEFRPQNSSYTFEEVLRIVTDSINSQISKEMCIRDRKKDANELEKLGNFINDDAVLTKLVDIKNAKKTELLLT